MSILLASLTSSILHGWLPGSFAILVVLALGPAVRRLLGARAAHLLWLLVILRFLVPNLPTLPWPHLPTPAVAWVAPESTKFTATARVLTEPGFAAMPAQASLPWLEMGWAAGAVFFLGVNFAQAWRARRLVRGAADIRGRAGIRHALRSLPAAPSSVRICETDRLRSPALCGIFRPVIFLPVGWAETLSPPELRCVLAHEIGHLRRGDILWRWAFLFVRALHWFNPLVWIAERAARFDQELACDEWVMQNARPSSLEEYGEVLLKAAQASAPRLAASSHMAESHRGLGRRISHLAAFRPHGRMALLTAFLTAVFLALLIGPTQSQAVPAQTLPADSPATPNEPRPTSTPPIANEIQPTGASHPPSITPPPPPVPGMHIEIASKFVEFTSRTERAILEGRTGEWSILSHDEYLKLLHDLQSSKADMLSAPSVTVPPGQRACIQITREFRYPTQYNTANNRVTPANFETTPVGVTLEVTPTVNAQKEITLVLAPRITEFEGFINYGSGIPNPRPPGKDTLTAVVDGKIQPGDEAIMQPVFAVRTLTGSAKLKEGETAVLGGISRTETRTVSDIVKGRKKTTTQTIERRLYLFVTPRLVPSGPPSAIGP